MRQALIVFALALTCGCSDSDEAQSSAPAGTDAGSGGSAGAGGSGGATGGAATGGAAGATGGAAGATGGSGGATGGGGGTPPVTGDCGNAENQIFPPGAAWNTPIDTAPLDGESDAIIAYLEGNVQSGARFQLDTSIQVLTADDSVTHQSFTPTSDFYGTECDPAPVPVPSDGAIEGESGYSCDGDGDCHLIVIDVPECRLFEMWRANITSTEFFGGCQAIWSIDAVPPETGRGDQCTSADAAGLPIAPLLFTADEVAAGEIPHAIRFIVPNANIRDGIYVRPGTHSTGATSGAGDAPPYSARLRLKAGVDTSGLNTAAQVVAEALKKYGMILADAGNITFTAQSDWYTTETWPGVGLGPHDLKDLQWSDFEVIELGERITYNGNCNRTPITN